MSDGLLALGPISTEYGEATFDPVSEIFTAVPHNAVDVSVPVGTDIPLPVGGTVERIDFDETGGLQLVIRTAEGFAQRLAHLSEILVPFGARVGAGEVVARSGESGLVSGPHLHYAVSSPAGEPVNPRAFVSEFATAAPRPSGIDVEMLRCLAAGGVWTTDRKCIRNPAALPGNPVEQIARLLTPIGAAFAWLTSPTSWTRLAFTAAGAGLIIVGLMAYAGALRVGGPQVTVQLPRTKVGA